MTKSNTIIELKKQGVVAVIRGTSYEEGHQTATACIKGNLKAIEIAYTNNNADMIIKQLSSDYQNNNTVLIGAGTVLDAPTAKNAIMAGAKYIVSPYIPGCMTIKEIITAMEYGCEIIKLFPGSAFGPNYINAIKGPLPYVSLMVTGGVNLNNAAEWFNAGIDAIGIGGELNKLAAKGQFETIKEIAQKYVNTKTRK